VYAESLMAGERLVELRSMASGEVITQPFLDYPCSERAVSCSVTFALRRCCLSGKPNLDWFAVAG